MPKPGEIAADWHVVDATDQVLGRLASRIAVILQGKHKPTFSRSVDTGDFVVVLNAEKVRTTGKKADVVEYDTYSRYPGGRHVYSYKRCRSCIRNACCSWRSSACCRRTSSAEIC